MLFFVAENKCNFCLPTRGTVLVHRANNLLVQSPHAYLEYFFVALLQAPRATSHCAFNATNKSNFMLLVVATPQ